MWYIEALFDISLWFGQVPSASNTPDPPDTPGLSSRGAPLPIALRDFIRLELQAAEYCNDYIMNILHNVRESRDRLPPASA